MTRSRPLVTVALALALALGMAATGADARTAKKPKKPAAVYAKLGPYVAGVTTLDLGDRKVEVWYPADKGSQKGKARDVYNLRDWLPDALRDKVPVETAPYETIAYRDVTASEKGPFPLVLFSHGYASFRDQSSFLTAHLATWGFVVAAPDHLERGLASVLGQAPAVKKTDSDVLRATADLLRAANSETDGPLAGRVKPGKIAVTGHSAGGFASIAFGSEPDVVTYIPMSAGHADDPAAAATAMPPKASMYVTGSVDTIVSLESVEDAYAHSPLPKRLVVLTNAGHLGLTDVCLIGASKGGVIAIADSLGIQVPDNLRPLATDGCEAGKLPPRDGFGVIDHYVTAQLRWAFKIDKKPLGLDAKTAKSFKGVKVLYSHQP